MNTTSVNLDRMLLNDNYNAEVDVISHEVDRYDAECTVLKTRSMKVVTMKAGQKATELYQL